MDFRRVDQFDRIFMGVKKAFLIWIFMGWCHLACTKPYYFDVADDSRVCYVEKDFLSKVICKKLHDEVQCLHFDVSKYQRQFDSLEELF